MLGLSAYALTSVRIPHAHSGVVYVAALDWAEAWREYDIVQVCFPCIAHHVFRGSGRPTTIMLDPSRAHLSRRGLLDSMLNRGNVEITSHQVWVHCAEQPKLHQMHPREQELV